jgi:hypothetical protein
VYWGSPTPDGRGGMNFSDPVEIQCRWQSSSKVVRDAKGNQIVCVAEVLVADDLAEQGKLYLGTMDDLDSDELDDPRLIIHAYSIQRFEKIPMFKSADTFVRKAYL